MTARRLSVAIFLALYAAGALVYACSSDKQDTGGASSGSPSATAPGPGRTGPLAPGTARAKLTPTTSEGGAEGTADFVEKNGETVVTVTIDNGGTMGNHGISIYENGSCDPTDAGPAYAAGNHWNPTDAGHGTPTMASHHLGDLGNVSIDFYGSGTFNFSSKNFMVLQRDGGNSILGRTLIFHEQLDDGVSPPFGNSGKRTACGVIEQVEDKTAKKKK